MKYFLFKKYVLFLAFIFMQVQGSELRYFATCVLPYNWTADGTTQVLLGQEKRRFGDCWFDFCGTRDKRDKNPLETAVRELNEETAYQLTFFRYPKAIKYFISEKKDPKSQKVIGNVVHYLLPVKYIDPAKIKYAAQTGKFKHVEKQEWKWVKAQDLLEGKVDLPFYDLFEAKVKDPIFVKNLKEVMQEGKEFAKKIRSKL